MNDFTEYPMSESDTSSKVLPLREAVKQYIKPGIKLHLAGGIGGPSAAICEIIRQHWGSTPAFTLIQSTVTGHAINLLHCKLLRKMIFAACVDISTHGRPSKVMQRVWANKSLPPCGTAKMALPYSSTPYISER
ncbi:MAG: hypothetical protein ACOC6S_02130 [Chloroflexota bacterium]